METADHHQDDQIPLSWRGRHRGQCVPGQRLRPPGHGPRLLPRPGPVGQQTTRPGGGPGPRRARSATPTSPSAARSAPAASRGWTSAPASASPSSRRCWPRWAPTRQTAAERLRAAKATAPGQLFTAGRRRPCAGATRAHASAGRTWAQDPATASTATSPSKSTGRSGPGPRCEVLRHTGIRIEELTELSHHSLIQYKLPATGELIPLLQIAPSKTDTERLLVISPELADVLSEIITRIRGQDGTVPLVTAYDYHERTCVANTPDRSRCCSSRHLRRTSASTTASRCYSSAVADRAIRRADSTTP